MHTLAFTIPILGLASIVSAAPKSSIGTDLRNHCKGMKSPVLSSSTGGKAICISGNVAVKASAANTKLNLASPANQFASTEIFTEYFQVDSTLPVSASGGKKTVSGTYNINAKLCFPATAESLSNFHTVQFLIHGISFDKLYWDIPGSSYVDAAAEAGYASFSYDRLGTGSSAHPDPIQVVQSAIQIEIAHQIIHDLRNGNIGIPAFQHVIGVGHSYGSIQALGLAVQYPKDLDAMILQGLSINTANLPATVAAWDLTIASKNSPKRFGSLPAGYQVIGSPVGDQTTFYRYPNFKTSLFTSLYSQQQTVTIGELFTLTEPVAPATQYTGPVQIIDGQNDFIFCASDCSAPTNQAAAALSALFPAAAAGSGNVLIPGTGHALNAHTTASTTYAHMLAFLKNNGF
jgi:pimeloyl-ACP methyl ester carboxylesterase